MKPDFSTLTQDNIVAFLGDIFDRRGGEEYLDHIRRNGEADANIATIRA